MGLGDFVAKITLRAEDAGASSAVAALTARVDALQASLSKSTGASSASAAALNKVTGAAAPAASALGGVGGAGSTAAKGLAEAASGGSAASGVMSALTSTTGLVTAGLIALAGAVGVGVGGGLFRSLVTDGIEFNSTLETTRTGLAGMIYGTREWTKANGEAATAQEKITVSMGLAENVQQKLIAAAAQTGLSYAGLLEGMQTAYGPALSKGVTNMDQLVRITTAASVATNALGLDTRMLKQELRSIFDGKQGPYDSLNRAFGIKASELEAARKSAEGVGGYLEKKLAPILEMNAANADNMTLAVSRLKTEWSRFAGEVSRPIFDKLKEVLNDVQGRLTPFQSDLTELSARFSSLLDYVIPLAEAFGRFGIEALKVAADLLPALGPLLDLLTGIVNIAADVTKAIGSDGIALGALAFAGYKAFGAIGPLVTALPKLTAAITEAGGVAAFASGAWATFTGAVTTATASFAASVTAIAATTAGLAAMTLGVGAAMLAVGALIVVWMQYRDEQKKVAESYGGLKDTMLLNLDAMVKKHPELSAKMEDLRNRIQATDRTNLAALDRLNNEYVKLTHTAQVMGGMRVAAGEAGVRVSDKEAKAAEKAAKEAEKAAEKAKALRAEYDATKQKLLDANENATTTGLEAIIVKIRQKWDKELATIRKKFGENSDLIALAESAKLAEMEKAESAGWEKLKKVAEDKARTYLSIVTKTFTKDVPAAIQTGFVAASALQWPAPTQLEVGVASGLERVRAQIGSFSTIVSRTVEALWGSMAKAFDDVFYAALTFDLDGLQKAFSEFGKNILKTVSQAFSDIVQRWLLTKLGIEQNPITGGFKFGGEGAQAFRAGNGTSLGQGALYAGMGYGVGSMIGGGGVGNQIGGAVGGLAGGIFAGTKLGASVLSFAGPVGTIVGALVGAIIGAIIGGLFNKNTEKSFRMQGSQYGTNEQKSEAWGGVVSSNNALRNDVYGILKTAGRTDLSKWLDQKMGLGGLNVKIHAGSNEDLQKDYEDFVTKHLPRWQMKELFGFRPTGKFQNIPGIDGVAEFASFNPETDNGPIPEMLRGLGFTNKKIKEIADQIDVRDPKKFVEWLNGLVGVAVGFNRLTKDLSASGSDLWAEGVKRNKATDLDGFRDSAKTILDLAAELPNYVGDEQLARARELIDLGDRYYENQIAYVQKLIALSDQIKASVASQIERMNLDTMSEDEKTAFYRDKAKSLFSQLGAASTADEIQRIMGEIQSSTGALWDLVKGKGGSAEWKVWITNLLNSSGAIADKKLQAIADEVAATNKGLSDAMKNARDLFTDVNSATSSTAGKVEDFGDATDDASESVEALGNAAAGGVTAIEQFVAALAAATAGIGGAAGAGRGTVGTDPAAPRMAVTAAEMVPLMRRYAGAATSRTA